MLRISYFHTPIRIFCAVTTSGKKCSVNPSLLAKMSWQNLMSNNLCNLCLGHWKYHASKYHHSVGFHYSSWDILHRTFFCGYLTFTRKQWIPLTELTCSHQCMSIKKTNNVTRTYDCMYNHPMNWLILSAVLTGQFICWKKLLYRVRIIKVLGKLFLCLGAFSSPDKFLGLAG